MGVPEKECYGTGGSGQRDRESANSFAGTNRSTIHGATLNLGDFKMTIATESKFQNDCIPWHCAAFQNRTTDISDSERAASDCSPSPDFELQVEFIFSFAAQAQHLGAGASEEGVEHVTTRNDFATRSVKNAGGVTPLADAHWSFSTSV